MVPSMVLLKREVAFSDDEAVSGCESICDGWEARGERPSRKEMIEAVTEYLRTFKGDAVVASPPELSSLHILRPPKPVGLPWACGELDKGHLSSADKNLVALYAGVHRPGSHMMTMGGYLIYDARNNSLSAIPQLPENDNHPAVGFKSAVVMCNGNDGGYVLAQLVRLWPGYSQAAVWLWKSSAPGSGWALQPARLPLPRTFCGHLCFSYRGSILCWVDLLGGMVVCDVGNDSQLRFVPLPLACPSPSYDTSGPWHRHNHPSATPRPRDHHRHVEEFRSMACVGDAIKFVCLDDNAEHVPGKDFDLTVYALSPDLSEWTVSRKYNVGNIWASESYQSTGMPKLLPSFPVLSIHEDGVIYLVLTCVRVVDEYDTQHCTARPRVVSTSQYLIRVDMENNKVQLYPQSLESRIHSQLLATEISAYQQLCLHDHPVLPVKYH